MTAATIGTQIRARDPGLPALLSPTQAGLSYGELAAVLDSVAFGLGSHGIAPNHRVGVALGNGIACAAVVVAVADYCAMVPVHPDAVPVEAERLLTNAQLSAVIVAPGHSPGIRHAAASLGVGVVEATSSEASNARVVLHFASEPAQPFAARGEQDLALILSTSGSTSVPKLVPHGAAAVAQAASNWARFHDLEPDDRTVLCLPLFHSFGLTGCVAPTLVSGGAALCLDRLEPKLVIEHLAAEQATWMSCVPTMLHGVVSELEREGRKLALKRTRFVRTGTAQLTEDLRLRAEAVLGTAVLASYGLSETNSVAANPAPPQKRRPGTVGVAYGAEVIVADETGSECVPGVVGEVLVKGPTVMRGYLSQPGGVDLDTSAPNPLVDGWFHTGDLGVMDADGYLRLAGRRKHLINRGGVSLSPLEIEQAIAALPEVAEVAVVGLAHPTLGEEVAAAVVWEAERQGTFDNLVAQLGGTLSASKLPTRWLEVEALDRSPVGKVIRDEVVAAFARADVGSTAQQRSDAEDRVLALWQLVLPDVVDAQPDDTFIGLGGDSLAALALIELVFAHHGIELRVDQVLGMRTLADMAELVTAAPADGAGARTLGALAETLAIRGEDSAVLSPIEQALWLEEQLAPGTSRYNESAVMHLVGELDLGRFRQALASLSNRHEALRTAFHTNRGIPERAVSGQVGPPLDVVDALGWDEHQVGVWLDRLRDQPFVISAAPLWRVGLLKLAAGEWLAVLTVHHLINDKRSSGYLWADLGRLYRNPGEELPALASTPAGWAHWQHQMEAGPDQARRRAYWTNRLAEFDHAMPLRKNVTVSSFAARVLETEPEPGLLRQLHTYATRVAATPFVVLQAALKAAVGELTGQDHVVVGTAVDARGSSRMDGVVGCFVNTIALPSKVDLDEGFVALVAREQARCNEAYQHQDVPFETVVGDLRAGGHARPNPIDIMFSTDPGDAPLDLGPDLAVARLDIAPSETKFDLSITARTGRDQGLSFCVDYRQSSFEAADVEALIDLVIKKLRTNLA